MEDYLVYLMPDLLLLLKSIQIMRIFWLNILWIFHRQMIMSIMDLLFSTRDFSSLSAMVHIPICWPMICRRIQQHSNIQFRKLFTVLLPHHVSVLRSRKENYFLSKHKLLKILPLVFVFTANLLFLHVFTHKQIFDFSFLFTLHLTYHSFINKVFIYQRCGRL